MEEGEEEEDEVEKDELEEDEMNEVGEEKGNDIFC